MKTVQNHRIRVTVPDHVWERFSSDIEPWALKQTLPRGVVKIHDREAVCRGRILSHAMLMLGNAAEARLLEQEQTTRPITHTEVLAEATDILMFRWLNEPGKCHYNVSEVWRRMTGGHRMSEGMQQDVARARAYATGALAPIDLHQAMAEFQKFWEETSAEGREPNQMDVDRKTKILALRMGRGSDGAGEIALAQAARMIAERRSIELNYRRNRGYSAGCEWQIEIIGGMPEQIGLCRTVANDAHTCSRCGYPQGADWLDDGETCPKCMLVN